MSEGSGNTQEKKSPVTKPTTVPVLPTMEEDPWTGDPDLPITVIAEKAPPDEMRFTGQVKNTEKKAEESNTEKA